MKLCSTAAPKQVLADAKLPLHDLPLPLHQDRFMPHMAKHRVRNTTSIVLTIQQKPWQLLPDFLSEVGPHVVTVRLVAWRRDRWPEVGLGTGQPALVSGWCQGCATALNKRKYCPLLIGGTDAWRDEVTFSRPKTPARNRTRVRQPAFPSPQKKCTWNQRRGREERKIISDARFLK